MNKIISKKALRFARANWNWKQRRTSLVTNDERENSVVALQVVGTGTPGSPASILLNSQGEFTRNTTLAFNCGEGFQRLCRLNSLKYAHIQHMFITRLSWDCVGGILGLGLSLSDFDVDKLTVHGRPELENFFNEISKWVNYSGFKFSMDTKCDFYEDNILKIRRVPLCSNPESSSSNSIIFAYVGHVKAVPAFLDIEKCIGLGICSPKLLLQLKSGQDVSLGDDTICKASDVHRLAEPERKFLVIDIPSIDFLNALNTNEMLLQNATTGSCEKEADLVVHFSPPDVMDNSKYRDFINKFPISTTHLVANEANRYSGFNSVYEDQHYLNHLNPQIFPLLGNGDESAHNQPKQNMYAEKFGSNVLSARTDQPFYFRPKFGLDTNHTAHKTPDERTNQIHQIEGFTASLENYRKIQKSHFAGMSLLNRSQDFPKIIFLGTSATVPSPHRNVSSTLIHTSENSSILLDCGEGTCGQIYRYYGTQANNIFANIRAVFISHLHVDHYTGCCELIRIRKKLQLNQKSPLFIFATPEFASYLKNYQKNIDSTAVDYVIISNTDLIRSNLQREIANDLNLKSLKTCHIPHIITSFAVRLNVNQSRNGKQTPFTLTYSGDTPLNKNFIEFATGSTVLIHEATYEDSLSKEAKRTNHCTMSQAIQQCSKIKADYTILTHFSHRQRIPVEATLPKGFGIALDNMELVESDLPLLNHLIEPLRLMHSNKIENDEKPMSPSTVLTNEKTVNQIQVTL